MKAIGIFLQSLALIVAVTLAPQLEITSIAWVLILAALALLFSGKSEGKFGFLGWLVTLAVAYGVGRAWISPAKDGARADGYLLILGWLVFTWTMFFSSEGQRGVWRGVLMILSIASVAIGVYQVVGDPTFTPFFAKRLTTTYASGFSGHYNHYANFLLGAGFLLAGGMFGMSMNSLRKKALAVVLVVCVVGILLSQSRGAFLGLGVGIMVCLLGWLVLLKKQKSPSFTLITLVVAIGIPVLAGIGYVSSNTLLKTRDMGDSKSSVLLSDRGRSDYFGFALDQALDHPAWGAGSRSYAYESYKYWKPGTLNAQELEFAHNELLQTAADYGFVGLGLVVLVLVCCAGNGKVDIFLGKDADLTAEKVGALAALAAMLTQSMFSFVFHMAPDVILLAVCLGILARKNVKRDDLAYIRGFDWKSLALPVFGSGVAVAAMVVAFPDARAWTLVGRPGAPGKSADRSEQYRGVKEALEIREDSTWQMIAAKLCNIFAAESQSPLDAREWTKRASDYTTQAIARNPYDPTTRLLYARFLDAQGKIEDAGPMYRLMLPRLDAREHVFNARFLYGRHCYLKSYMLWKEGKGDAGLAWAEEAVAQMKISNGLRWFGPETLFGRELDRAEKFVAYLRTNHFQPKDEGLPPKVATW